MKLGYTYIKNKMLVKRCIEKNDRKVAKCIELKCKRERKEKRNS